MEITTDNPSRSSQRPTSQSASRTLSKMGWNPSPQDNQEVTVYAQQHGPTNSCTLDQKNKKTAPSLGSSQEL